MQLSEAGEKTASWYEQEKAQAKDWLGRIKHKTEKVTDKVSDDLSAGYYRAKGKARSAYHDAADQYYRTKSSFRQAGRDGADAIDDWKHRIQDAARNREDPIVEEIDRVKNRQWLREVDRALEAEPFGHPRFINRVSAFKPYSTNVHSSMINHR